MNDPHEPGRDDDEPSPSSVEGSDPTSQMRRNAPYDVAIHEMHEAPAVSTRFHEDPADLVIASAPSPVIGKDPAVDREPAPKSKGGSIAWMVLVVAAGLLAAWVYTRLR